MDARHCPGASHARSPSFASARLVIFSLFPNRSDFTALDPSPDKRSKARTQHSSSSTKNTDGLAGDHRATITLAEVTPSHRRDASELAVEYIATDPPSYAAMNTPGKWGLKSSDTTASFGALAAACPASNGSHGENDLGGTGAPYLAPRSTRPSSPAT